MDLGTGNGAVISIAAEINNNRSRNFSLHGVDAADIDPAIYVKTASKALSLITFHPRTRMEALPFSDGSITAVCGQYALEYSEVEKSIAEIIRVLVSGGCFQFLVHAQDSALISRSRTQLAQAETILHSNLMDAFRIALPLITQAENAPSGDAAKFQIAKDAFDKFNHIFTKLQTGFQKDEDQSVPSNFLEALSQLYQSRRRFGEIAVMRMLDDMFMRLNAQAQRLRDLINAALDEDGINNLAKTLEQKGAYVNAPQKARSGKSEVLLGWWIDGRISH